MGVKFVLLLYVAFGIATLPVTSVADWSDGVDASIYDWPWHVLVYVVTPNNDLSDDSQCGGTIIDAHHVLTAAHCLLELARRRMPEAQMHRFVTVYPEFQTYDYGNLMSKRRLHPDRVIYNKASMNNQLHEDELSALPDDIAMLVFKEPIHFTDGVQPVCMPEKPVQPNTTCYVVGWGVTEKQKALHMHYGELQQAPEILATSKYCVEQANLSSYTQDFDRQKIIFGMLLRMYEQMICMAQQDPVTGACKGDSGGGLVCQQEDGSWVLQGIVSAGIPSKKLQRRRTPADFCAAKTTVYIKVLRHKKWIESNMLKWTDEHVHTLKQLRKNSANYLP